MEAASSFRRGLPRRTARRGFTIAEVMMAAAIMALAISTSITTMQRAFLSLDAARNVTLASHIMQSEMERMRLRDWSIIDAYPSTETTLTIDPSFTGNAGIANRFTLSRSVSTIRPGMKQITLRVSWRGYDGRQQSRFYTTYYGQNGLYDYFYNSF